MERIHDAQVRINLYANIKFTNIHIGYYPSFTF